MVNTPHLPVFPKSTATNNNATSHGQIVNHAAAKLNDLYGSGTNIPRLDGPEKFCRSSMGHVHDGSSGSGGTINNGVPNNGVYGDDGDLIAGQHAGRVPSTSSRNCDGLRNGGGGNSWSGAQSPALSNTSGRFGGRAMAAAQQQAALAGLRMGAYNLGPTSPTQCRTD